MNKTLFLAGVVVAVLGIAAWSYAHGPGPGFSRGPAMMGPAMMGPGHMHADWGPGHGPCWQTTELTPEQTKAFEERTKESVEHYLERFLPGYKLEKKEEKKE